MSNVNPDDVNDVNDLINLNPNADNPDEDPHHVDLHQSDTEDEFQSDSDNDDYGATLEPQRSHQQWRIQHFTAGDSKFTAPKLMRFINRDTFT
ncbi:hypothetical protein CC80DRAFT_553515 [Byssothecium circinans]|uniref:Uncharacterized protein n=1 Tax=Byssothecium circinans TaxID=147558 RepID=A0A6A5TEC1_9PLEO|nr:hypothetical protein CC80DRAFT_553515 [Byssothecium circinans]